MSPEDRLRKLARAPANTVCPNCGQTKKFGFGTVCVKFGTFVCNECKTSHQAISHRCKSISMSSWTASEVDAVQGNDHCRQTWLQHAPPIGQGGRPAQGMPIDVFKRFVIDAYEHRRYYGEASQQQQQQQQQFHSTSSASTTPAPAATNAMPPPPVAPPAADLLDFASPSSSTVPPATNSNHTQFATNFQAPASNHDPFASTRTSTTVSMNSAPTTASKPAATFDTTANHDPFAPSSTAPATSSSFNDFASFAAPTASSSSSFAFINTADTQKPPIMGNTGSASSLAISGMNALANNNQNGQQQINIGGTGMMNNSGMMNGGGFHNNNNMMNGGGFHNNNSMMNGGGFQNNNNMMNGGGFQNNNSMMNGGGFQNNNNMMNGGGFQNNNSMMNGGGFQNNNNMMNGGGFQNNNSMMMNGNMNSNGMMMMNNGMNGMVNNNMNGMMMMNNNSNGSQHPMSFQGSSGSRISNMSHAVQQQTQKKKDAFSDLLPF